VGWEERLDAALGLMRQVEEDYITVLIERGKGTEWSMTGVDVFNLCSLPSGILAIYKPHPFVLLAPYPHATHP
jgi:hypothetical protein